MTYKFGFNSILNFIIGKKIIIKIYFNFLNSIFELETYARVNEMSNKAI